MEAKNKQQVYDDIVAHIKEQGGAHSTWYCGITHDWENRLFVEHKVPQETDYWYIARQCHSNNSAREVEDALHEWGCDGGPSGGDEATVYVYAYLKGTKTDP